MIRKVLIAEDHESANISVQKTLEVLQVRSVDHVYYCDDALSKIEHALVAGESYDLLITDLIFEQDYRAQKISGGAALIAAARKVQPDLKILVFSAENKPAVIDSFFRNHEIDGYVRKARNDAQELQAAFEKISKNQRHYPKQVAEFAKHQNAHSFTDYDVTIISLLAQGIPQKNIPAYLLENNIKPSGLSSVEKRFNQIRGVFDFSNNEQLVAFCKDMGII
ncbi:MAG: response regulator [Chitinophagaceae bacterium]|nr:MAG: response regulator [Chitinophagaceae bacterium]